ncbi:MULTISPECIES: hypothetical protein [unclassified Lentimonas]|uniref:hypothetical protein n=1 Tax=unclassified Lentimonas TaxID=2630993 RepID=UPI001324D096|nr:MULTISPECIES: hypothetical protein [unclassified Lentimonas]CAA6691932.1 Unannotated [Lentimonas sp. CC10]CAA6697656.1 Unannotated [Lentimonas sp. CC19]CAA7071488.1 Unannotated [Lentimonas sp. CC11]
MRACILFLLCGLLTSTTVAADRVARILYYNAPADAPETAYAHQAGKKPQEVELGRHNFSESFKLAEETKHLFFLPNALPENTPAPSGAPSVEIPISWNKVLIIVLEDESNPTLPIQFKAINANDDAFGPGDTCFVNFSKVTVLGTVGDKDLILKPSEFEIISQPRKDRGMYLQKLDAYHQGEKIRRRLVQQKCQYDPSERVLTFMVASPPPRMVKVYSAPILDF